MCENNENKENSEHIDLKIILRIPKEKSMIYIKESQKIVFNWFFVVEFAWF